MAPTTRATATKLEADYASAVTKLLAAAIHSVYKAFKGLNEDLEKIRVHDPNMWRFTFEETRGKVDELKKIWKKVCDTLFEEKTPEIIDEMRRKEAEVNDHRYLRNGMPTGLITALKNMAEEATKARERAEAMKADLQGNNREGDLLHVQIMSNDAMKIADRIAELIDNGSFILINAAS